MAFQANRPSEFRGKTDKYLPNISLELKRCLKKTFPRLEDKSFQLKGKALTELSEALTEFGEDIHCELGLWESIEEYNQEFFGCKIPFQDSQENKTVKFSVERVKYFLWQSYSDIVANLTVSPRHSDLEKLARITSDFLTQAFEKVPASSGIKDLLNRPNEFAWDIKQKLIWLGRYSYLFRYECTEYIKANGGEYSIKNIDDFICEIPTCWSGLPAVDLLAKLLKLEGQDKEDLLGWYERHISYYRVDSVKDKLLTVKNLVNQEDYQINIGDQADRFIKDNIYLGTLIKWRDIWYWSGQQNNLGIQSEKEQEKLRVEILSKVPRLAYRCCPDMLEITKKRLIEHHQNFVKFHGQDIAEFPDGEKMAEAMKKQMRQEQLESDSSKNEVELKYPDYLLNSKNGVAVYFNSDEGQEITVNYNDILKGFRKEGKDLTEEEEKALIFFISSDLISANFANRLLNSYGSKSVLRAFKLDNLSEEYSIEFLLRRYKGAYFKERKPNISWYAITEKEK